MRRALVLPLPMVLAALGCFSERRTLTGLENIECSVALPSPGRNEVLVAIRDFAFHPAEVRVPAGTTVTWINCEPPAVAPHTSTGDGGVWASPSLQSGGGTFSRTFVAPGRFGYHCAPHPFMQAAVVVDG